ncbi:MAG: hypothetical protein ACFNLO_12305, partial [Selenomonas massiliensis]
MQKLWHTRRREILAGGACLLILFAVFFLRPEHEPPAEESDIGTIRMAEVLAAHPSYARLSALRAEERTLTLLLRDLPALPAVDPPQTEEAPFEDSVWQKNAQTVISTRVELEREQKRLTEVYRKQTEPDYEARKKAIDDEYLNAILNINLKIDNQRAMHGPQVSEEELARERGRWEAERALLKEERGMRQRELYRQWEEEIRAYVAARMEPQQAAWTKRAQETVDAQKAEAERMRKEVEERSAQEMERALAAQTEKSAASARAARLAAVCAEADALEAEIMRDVRSRAAKLALQH